MSYVKDNLMPDEDVLINARVHRAIFLPAILMFIVFLIIFLISYNAVLAEYFTDDGSIAVVFCGAYLILLFSIFSGISALITLNTTEFAVTNTRLIGKTGFLRRNSIDILLQKVESISIHQNIMGRLLNFGTLTITGTGGTKGIFKAISDPLSIRIKTNQIIDKSLNKSGN